MTQFLERFSQQRLADDSDYTWADWAEAIALLGLTSLAPLVEEEWRKNDVLQDFLELKEFKGELAKAVSAPGDRAQLETYSLGYIEDAVGELEWTRELGEKDDADEIDEDEDNPLWDPDEDISQPFHNPMRHVGRNDPCPCGSGKKAKRCCLATG
jgi:uncharacterized protein YecA (UPF0149 family)